jgi:hypothetical protein
MYVNEMNLNALKQLSTKYSVLSTHNPSQGYNMQHSAIAFNCSRPRETKVIYIIAPSAHA